MIITINSSIKKDLEDRYAHSRVEVLPNNIELPETIGSDFRQEVDADPGTILISTAGVFTKGKNIDLLIRAFVRAQLDDALLVVVGDISTRDLHERKRLEILAENLGISGKVVFTGWRKDAGNIIRSTDLFVLPSISEGCPLALLEALGLGVPCLGSRIPEVKEVLYYEELLFDPTSEEELAQKLLSCTNDRTLALWHKLCEKRRGVYTFDWDQRLLDTLSHAGVAA
jgi:glycosyltransferase involved in cell wall biosynthesis